MAGQLVSDSRGRERRGGGEKKIECPSRSKSLKTDWDGERRERIPDEILV